MAYPHADSPTQVSYRRPPPPRPLTTFRTHKKAICEKFEPEVLCEAPVTPYGACLASGRGAHACTGGRAMFRRLMCLATLGGLVTTFGVFAGSIASSASSGPSGQ